MKAKNTKTTAKKSTSKKVARVDASKKVNPLDLSSDQDLSIALMNLISLEEHFFFSGAKTQKTGFYDLINTVRDMRKELMSRIVKKSSAENGEVWCISKHLLAASMRLMEVINMDLIDLNGVKKIAPDVYEKCVVDNQDAAKNVAPADTTDVAQSRSVVRRLGNWVKNAVNCCIE